MCLCSNQSSLFSFSCTALWWQTERCAGPLKLGFVIFKLFFQQAVAVAQLVGSSYFQSHISTARIPNHQLFLWMFSRFVCAFIYCGLGFESQAHHDSSFIWFIWLKLSFLVEMKRKLKIEKKLGQNFKHFLEHFATNCIKNRVREWAVNVPK